MNGLADIFRLQQGINLTYLSPDRIALLEQSIEMHIAGGYWWRVVADFFVPECLLLAKTFLDLRDQPGLRSAAHGG